MTYTLAIETSCDETSIAIIKDKTLIKSNLISSQIKAHQKFGGVVPEVASRLHCEIIHTLIDQALAEASISLNDINQIAVTMGPGLEGCLLVGVSVAKTLATFLNIPLIPVNHIHGHIYAFSQYQPTLSYPSIALVISGGHTDLILMKKEGHFEKLGKTRDDAAGEAFDKIARYLNLGYPGGPIIEKLAAQGNPEKFKLPIAMKQTPYEFSFSGLKTATIECIDKLDNPQDHIHDICASFQHTVIETIILKSIQACKLQDVDNIIVAGGVASNKTLMTKFSKECTLASIKPITIEPKLCTDNAAMIALAATHLGNIYNLSDAEISAKPNLSYAI